MTRPNKVALVGVGVWGAMLASQSGVVLGTGSIATYPPHMKRWSDRTEDFEVIKQHIVRKEHVVVITDVIATGKTVRRVITRLKEWNPGAKYYVVAIVCNALLVTNKHVKLELPWRVVYGIGCKSIPLLTPSTFGLPSIKELFA